VRKIPQPPAQKSEPGVVFTPQGGTIKVTKKKYPMDINRLHWRWNKCVIRHAECMYMKPYYHLSHGRETMHTPKVLIVDDEFLIRWSLVQLLSEEEYEVTAVEDGWKAIEIARVEHFDFVITDLSMPGLDGWGLLDKLMEFQFPPRVIIMTADAEEDHRRTIKEKGGWGYVEKSYLIQDIKKILKAGCQE
jgi:CheY-like chemotaxis protein